MLEALICASKTCIRESIDINWPISLNEKIQLLIDNNVTFCVYGHAVDLLCGVKSHHFSEYIVSYSEDETYGIFGDTQNYFYAICRILEMNERSLRKYVCRTSLFFVRDRGWQRVILNAETNGQDEEEEQEETERNYYQVGSLLDLAMMNVLRIKKIQK